MDNNKPSQDNEEEMKDSLTEEQETQQETTLVPEMLKEENQRTPKGKSSVVWMIISGILAAALIIVIVYPPFGGGREAVASVNGTDISKDELYNELVSLGGESTLNSMITMKLIDQEAAKAKVSVTDEDVNAEIESLKTQYGGEEGLNTALSQSGMTMDSLKKNTEVQVKIRKILEPKTTVKDEDISAYYEENKATFATPEQVKASHILVATKEEADEIKKQLDEGADFATLASEKSTDTASAASGGDLGFFGKGEMVEPFEKAAFSMQIDEISEPVKSDFGYHIIKKTDYKKATDPTLEDKKEDIRKILVEQQVGELSTNWMTELRSNATITNTLEPAEENADAADSADSAQDTESSPNE
ncbi:foldase protein PrsA [Paenibacillus xylanilyticus]|uniref:Foldase protein PrsA n=1 Tax=Paenibacillus xylanilyticus TaxID=248903 RepID=A0A7Y6C368_9BACL|nr:peptidylprolyl isomerase [Paenibacillus xylanilyticus]NUU79203.1 peptidylprolyl isomerase [Paenibacillus xylanilyticus]